MDINGIALVTGAGECPIILALVKFPDTCIGSGIGKACAHAYALEGAAGVVFADVNKLAAEQSASASKALATNQDYRFLVVEVDVTNEASVETMISNVLTEFGRIDYALNCAGVGSQIFLFFRIECSVSIKVSKANTRNFFPLDWGKKSGRNRRKFGF